MFRAAVSFAVVAFASFLCGAQAQTLTTLYSFNTGSDGQIPMAGLTYHGGMLYGTTEFGGTTGNGTVFQVNASTGAETVLHSFGFVGGADGTSPLAGLIYQGGLLYGTTMSGGGTSCAKQGCGTVFSVDPANGTETVIYGFMGGSDGASPSAGLVYNGGNLYGTTMKGGAKGFGTVFEVNLATGAESVLYDFASKKIGKYPEAGLIYRDGALYGTTTHGGPARAGTVFKVNAKTGAKKLLYSFAGGNDGEDPQAGLVFYNGTLYGTTYEGGSGTCRMGNQHYGCGTAFSINPATGAETILARFVVVSQGNSPYAGLIEQGGYLYGTAVAGGNSKDCGTYGCGTVFKLDPATGAATVLHNFSFATDGSNPYGGLIYHDGTFYGTTADGGASDAGTVFKLVP
jgi:uncharacterized repeat protein (TIGR03803 family)